MSTYHVGDQVKVTTTFTVNDVATTPTTYHARIRHPDGTEVTLTPVLAGAGVLETTLPVFDAGGIWRWRVAGTAGVVSADEGSVTVNGTRFTTP